MVKFYRWVSPVDSGKWWNGPQYREIYVSPMDVAAVVAVNHTSYNSRGVSVEIVVPKIILAGHHEFEVEGTMEGVVEKLSADMSQKGKESEDDSI